MSKKGQLIMKSFEGRALIYPEDQILQNKEDHIFYISFVGSRSILISAEKPKENTIQSFYIEVATSSDVDKKNYASIIAAYLTINRIKYVLDKTLLCQPVNNETTLYIIGILKMFLVTNGFMEKTYYIKNSEEIFYDELYFEGLMIIPPMTKIKRNISVNLSPRNGLFSLEKGISTFEKLKKKDLILEHKNNLFLREILVTSNLEEVLQTFVLEQSVIDKIKEEMLKGKHERELEKSLSKEELKMKSEIMKIIRDKNPLVYKNEVSGVEISFDGNLITIEKGKLPYIESEKDNKDSNTQRNLLLQVMRTNGFIDEENKILMPFSMKEIESVFLITEGTNKCPTNIFFRKDNFNLDIAKEYNVIKHVIELNSSFMNKK